MADDGSSKNGKWLRALLTLFLVFIVLAGMIALISGVTFWPDSQFMLWAWRFVWWGLVPLCLVASVFLVKNKR